MAVNFSLLRAQHFTLDAGQLKIDSVIPVFSFVKELGCNYADSAYEVSIEYPEFVPMKRKEVRRYKKLTGEALPEWPVIDAYTGVSRRKGRLYSSFVPMIRRDGKNLKLSSFDLKVKARPLENRLPDSASQSISRLAGQRYASHSVLASGRWVKIGVPATGIYQLTDSLLRAAGFDNPQKVKVYGYGGGAQPEKLTPDYLRDTDDLQQVPTAMVGQRRVFWAMGPVNWNSETAIGRTRNPYSDKGYYFLSDSDDSSPVLLDSAQFVDSYSEMPVFFHSLHEVDDYAWFYGGRNLYEAQVFGHGVTHSYSMFTGGRRDATLTICMSYNNYCNASVLVDGKEVGQIVVDKATTSSSGGKSFPDEYSRAAAGTWTFYVGDMPDADSVEVAIRQTSGATMRLDWIEMCFDAGQPIENVLGQQLPLPTIEGLIACQDLHADGPADMVIIIPESGEQEEQAQRIAELHQRQESLRVRIVKANELYNEFSSGTPDANAYRRYLKMLYDRAESDADMPQYLLLLGDAAFDNRMNTSNFRLCHPKDFLLCYESENSFSETACYVTDDYFAILDDNEGGDLIKTDKSDLAVGRLPARTPEEAAVMIDKLYSYSRNDNAGSWENDICLMGDDGNANMHMNDAESIAAIIETKWPDYHLTKVYWDAYARTTVATGYSYPDVTRIVLEKMRNGALIMNYSGHGSPSVLSHENVVTLSDFKQPGQMRLPLWFTASCEVAPFDGYMENIGEQAMFNPTAGAVALIGTTRTVYAAHNKMMNKAFMTYVLSKDDNGRPLAIGEALRCAKNDQVNGSKTTLKAGINKFHFSLLGDPALRLPLPTSTAVIDSIAGHAVEEGLQHLLAGDSITVTGHVQGHDDMTGVATIILKDAVQTITCRMNPLSASEMPAKPLVYKDRPGVLFCGSDSIRQGRFSITIAIPKDIAYSDETGKIIVYAVDDSHTTIAHGAYSNFTMGSAQSYEPEGYGPEIRAWLESPYFRNGETTCTRPLLHADIYDSDGINASDGGIGHNIELVIDGKTAQTYNLNSYFSYTFGDFKQGSLDFTLPAMDEGHHHLTLRAWDVLNFSSKVDLVFVSGSRSISGISDASASDVEATTNAFDLQGRRTSMQEGRHGNMLLMRYMDGSVKKIVLKKQ